MSASASDAFQVLIIEDDPNLRQVIATLLADEGYAVAAVESGEEAIAIARGAPVEKFDLIVADIRMPGIDGLDTLQHLRNADPTLHSLVMTGYASEEDPIRALHIGVQAYLRKPFSLDDFLSRVRDLAGRCRAARLQRNALERVGQSLNWALRRSLTEGVKSGSRTFVELIRLVKGLAQNLGLERGHETPWLETAALVACLRRYGLQGVIPGEEPLWPEPVEVILGSLEERWDGQGIPDGLVGDSIPIGARLVAVAVAAWQFGCSLGDGHGQRLGDLDPGRYDPQILDILAHHRTAPASLSLERAAQRLLPVASILLENGAYRQVREVYREILATTTLARERMEALLGLTQVALQQGDVDEALAYARQVIEGSESVGPLSRGEAYMRLGVALCSKGLSTGLECFRRARGLFSSTRYPLGQSEASLALAHFGNQVIDLSREDLEEFLRPEHLPRWIRTTPWLVPCLLDRCDEESVVRRVVRTVQRENPSYTKKLMASQGLSSIARRRLATLLEASAPEAREAAPEAAPGLQIYSLGNFEVFRLGNRIDERVWPTQKVKYLLARLLLDLGRPVSEDGLIDDFWAGELEKGRRNLSWGLTQLRKVLREQTGEGAVITRKETSVVLSFNDAPWHDITELEKAIAQAEAAPTLSAQSCSAILALYRGPYLPDCYMDWAVSTRDRLDRRVSTFLGRVMQNTAEVSEALRAEVAHRLLEHDPCHQPAYAELMSQALQAGRPEEALRLFKKAEAWLKRDLGMEPDLKLVELSYRAELGLTSPK